MIDLHSHTTESDGSLSPNQLIQEARGAGVRILGIADHDTFAGYDQAKELARKAGPELICGVELSTSLHGYSAHVLGYFLYGDPPADFRAWVHGMQASRRERNIRLAARLRDIGLDVTVEEAEARGRGVTGRPHFAQVLAEKQYVLSVRQAFDEYLGKSGRAYVPRSEPLFEDAVRRIRGAGGIASLAHPVRLHADLCSMLPGLQAAGLNAIEAYHSDHSPEATEMYLSLAKTHALLVTGGSDFHGPAVKPGIELGTGRNGNLHIPDDLVERLRSKPRVESSEDCRGDSRLTC